MEVKIEETGPITKNLTVVMPKARVEAEFNSFFDSMRDRAQVKGFRPGKAPNDALRAHFGDVVNAEVTTRLVYAGVTDAAREHNLELAGNPVLIEEHRATEKRKQVGHLRLDGSFEFTAMIEVSPTIEIKDYKNIEVDVEAPDVEGWVDAKLQEYREMFADREPVMDRPSQEGDEIVVDYEGFLDGESMEGTKAEMQTITLGSGQFIPGFEEGLTGVEPSSEFEFDVRFPEDYHASHLAGQVLKFKGWLHSITKVELHPLNDELAEMAVFENLEALKEDLRGRGLEEFVKPQKATTLDKIMTKLIEQNPFEVPNGWVESEMRITAARLGMQQMPEDSGILDQLREIAHRVCQQNYILDQIYQKEENIHLSPEDMQAILHQEGQKSGHSAEDYLAQLRSAQAYEGFVSFHEHQRTIDYLLETAKVKEKENG